MSSDHEEFDLVQEAEAEVEQVERDPDDANEGNNGEPSEDRQVIKPKRVRNPQPKLNVDSLKGPRGLMAMPELFMKQNYRGKGYEQQDLRVLLKTYEYWCHRLFPKCPFGECVERLEKLGTKKAVITNIKKIRMGLFEVDEPIEKPESSDEEEREERRNPETEFDNLLNEAGPSQAPQLTEEQLETIRINKEKAMKLRQEKLRTIREQVQTKLSVSEKLPQKETENIEIDDVEEKTESHGLNEESDQILGSKKGFEVEEKQVLKSKKRILSDSDESENENFEATGISKTKKRMLLDSEESNDGKENVGGGKSFGENGSLEDKNGSINEQQVLKTKSILSDSEDENEKGYFDGKKILDVSKMKKRMLLDSEESSDETGNVESRNNLEENVSMKGRKGSRSEGNNVLKSVKRILSDSEESENGDFVSKKVLEEMQKTKKGILSDSEESNDEKENVKGRENFEGNRSFKDKEVSKSKKSDSDEFENEKENIEGNGIEKRVLSNPEDSNSKKENLVENNFEGAEGDERFEMEVDPKD